MKALKPDKGWATIELDLTGYTGLGQWRFRVATALIYIAALLLRMDLRVIYPGRNGPNDSGESTR